MGLLATPDSICTYDTVVISAILPINTPPTVNYVWNIGSAQLVSGNLNGTGPIKLKYTNKGIKIVTLDVVAAPTDTFCSINRSVVVNVIGDVPHFMLSTIDTICANANDTIHISGTTNVCGISTYPASGGVLSTVGTNTPTSATANLPTPFRGFYTESKCQMLYTATELINAGLQPGVITEIGWNVINKLSTTSSQSGCGNQPYGGFSISIACVSYNTLMTIDKTTPLTQVYTTSTYNTTLGMNMFTLQTLYVWDGVSNLLVQTCFDNGVSCWTQDDRVAKTNVGVGYCTYAFSDTDPLLGCDQNYPQNATINTNSDRPDITFRVANVILPISTTFTWTSNPIGFNSNLQNPVVNPSTTTTYYVTANDGGCITKDTVKITVSKLNIKLNKDTTICLGDTVLLKVIGNNITSYSWIPNISTNSQSLVHPNTTKKYIVNVTNSLGCQSSDTATVKVNNVVINYKSNDTLVCKNKPVSLNITSTGAYFWNWNGTNSLTPNNTTYTNLNVLVKDSITIIAKDSIGCSDTTFIKVGIKPNPLPTFTVQSDICFGECDTIHYIGNGGPNTQFTWSSPGSNSNLTNPSVPVFCWTSSGTKNIYLTILDSTCSSSDTMSVNIHTPNKPIISGDSALCKGSDIVLTVSPNGSYTWSTGSTTDTIHVSKNGKYKVKLVNMWGCIDSTWRNVIFYPNPISNAGRDTTILVGNYVNLDGLNSQLASQYYWSIGSTSPTFLYNPQNDTWVTLTVTSIDGCTDIDSVLLQVLQCRLPVVPNAFSPNDDGIDDEFKIANPDDFTKIDYFEIYNRWGELVFATNDKTKGWNGKYRSVEQPVGVYVYQIMVTCNSNHYRIRGDVTILR
jgi:gliding motility-associated-like protein